MQKRLFLAVVALLVIAVIGVLVWQNHEKAKIAQNIESIKQQVPSYFIDSNAKLQTTDPNLIKSLRLNKNENVTQGITYEVQKTAPEAFGAIFDNMKKNGWISIGGSQDGQNSFTVKMRKENEYLYIVVQKKTEKTSIISLMPIKR